MFWGSDCCITNLFLVVTYQASSKYRDIGIDTEIVLKGDSDSAFDSGIDIGIDIYMDSTYKYFLSLGGWLI